MIINDHGISPHRFWCHTSDRVHVRSCMLKIEFLEYDVSEEIEGLVDCIKWTFRGLGEFEGSFH